MPEASGIGLALAWLRPAPWPEDGNNVSPQGALVLGDVCMLPEERIEEAACERLGEGRVNGRRGAGQYDKL